MGNYLKMPDRQRVLALLELGWSYRRIERETGVRRETVARYDPRRQAKAANLSTGSESTSDELTDGEPNAANLSAGSSHAHGPPGVAEPYRAQIEAGLRQGLTAQRIYQDLCEQEAYPHKYSSVRRYVRRLKHQHPKLVDVMEHPPGEEAQVDYFQGPPTFNEAQGRWRRPWIFRMTLSCYLTGPRSLRDSGAAGAGMRGRRGRRGSALSPPYVLRRARLWDSHMVYTSSPSRSLINTGCSHSGQ